MKTLVTGASGFVGYHLVSALLKDGHSVRAMALPAESVDPLRKLGAEVVWGDVRRADQIIAAMNGIDTVFHLAAIHGLWRPKKDYLDVNVSGTENVCKAVLTAGARRMVFASSWTYYGMGLRRLVDESFPANPFRDVYAETKAAGDKLVQDYIVRESLPAVIVRLGTMFGPGDHVNFGRMSERLRGGKAIIIGSGRNAVPFVYVADAVEGMILAALNDHAVGKAYNLTTDDPVTQQELWNAVAKELGARAPRLHVPYFPLYLLAYFAEKAVKMDAPQRQPIITRVGVKLFGTENRHVIDKARRELGYFPRVPVLEGVKITAAWYNRKAA
jgi:nucleoside-diphosphate-sugar epimerase